MAHNFNPEESQIEARIRLKHARERSGKHPEELAQHVYNSTPAYYDLENCDGELYSSISLKELAELCSAIGIRARDLFDNEQNDCQTVSPEQLIAKVREHLDKTGMPIAEFEELIGFEIAPSLEDFSEVTDWSIDFLRWLCHELELDWRCALL